MNAPNRLEIANALRFLAIDAVEKAKSGHPGAPMGMADMAESLWRHVLKHNPSNPNWPDRDRFVLSNGHASMLVYALLHLTGYDISLDQIKAFRQMGSITPGHPEFGMTPGVETTTGPLGQGLTNAVGMALAEKILAAEFNKPGLEIVNHNTWVFLGDGCLMEGISHEAAALAGVWGLGKLTCLYDDNGISIDGHVEGWFNEDTAARFRAYGWQVIGPIDGHDASQIDAALSESRNDSARPTLIICKTDIGRGSPNKVGTHDVHGAPLGADEITATRAALGWSHEPFVIPETIRSAWDARSNGQLQEAAWQALFDRYRQQYPNEASEYERRMRGELPADWQSIKTTIFDQAAACSGSVATRKSSQNVLETLIAQLPELLGGSADLTGSNLTAGKKSVALHDASWKSVPNYISYGVREFGMTAIMNGVALHGGFIPYGGTFAVFSDYSRNAIRMSALMNLRVIHVLTHDSIGLGEDGPTHQPIEHVSSLRLIPRLNVWRPCDEVETAAAWIDAIESKNRPSALFLSRQGLTQHPSSQQRQEAIRRGGYILQEATGTPKVVIMATGSEVEIAVSAKALLEAQGIGTRVISMPCTRLFDEQDRQWKDEVLGTNLPRFAIEAGHPDFWRKYDVDEDSIIGLADFGESAPAPQLYKHFGLTAENLSAIVLQHIQAK
ncbi:MAG: transketolase [Fluviibacter sp.]